MDNSLPVASDPATKSTDLSVGGYKLIYMFSYIDPTTGKSASIAHNGLLKIGDTTVHLPEAYRKDPSQIPESLLEHAAHKRIKEITGTGRMPYTLHHVEIAMYMDKFDASDTAIKSLDKAYSGYMFKLNDHGAPVTFRDYDFSHHMKSYKVKSVDPTGNSAATSEWYAISLNDAIVMLNDFRKGNSRSGASIAVYDEIILRDEQRNAIKLTLSKYPKNPRKGCSYKMLWNAKPRFGKTTTSLATIEEMDNGGYGVNHVLVATHRPDVRGSWLEDFRKSNLKSLGWLFRSKDNCSFDDAMLDAKASGKKLIYFVSLQDLRGSYGNDDLNNPDFNDPKKNQGIFNTHFDLIITDEVHEGTLTELAKRTMRALNASYYLDLSGTPFNILQADSWDDQELSMRFTYDGVFSWSYVDERKAKIAWENDPDKAHLRNPYADLPEMVFVSYDIDDVLKDVEAKMSTNENYAGVVFSINELFATYNTVNEIGKNIQRFVHEDDVVEFLTRIRGDRKRTLKGSAFPYAGDYENGFHHTLWMLPSVDACMAMEYLLKNDASAGFQGYGIVNATGRGNSASNNSDALAIERVQNKIKEKERTITLSYRMLTTGVTVPEWSAVFMMNNNNSPMAYLQTAFRAGTPGMLPNGMMKEKAYVFDFNSDRTLIMAMEHANNYAKTKFQEAQGEGTLTSEDLTSPEFKAHVEEYFEHLNVFTSINGIFVRQSADVIMTKLNDIFVNEIVSKGFNSSLIWNNSALRQISVSTAALMNRVNALGGSKKDSKVEIVVTKTSAEDLAKLKEIDQKTKARKKFNEEQALAAKREADARQNAEEEAKRIEREAEESGEEIPEHDTLVDTLMSADLGPDHRIPDDSEAPEAPTEEERKIVENVRASKEQDKKNRENVEHLLASIAARFALLVFAIGSDEDITAVNFIDLLDDESWAEFMPKGLKRLMPEGTLPIEERLEADPNADLYWADIVPLLNGDFFWRAVGRVREMTNEIMNKPILERSFRLMMIFTTFMNPDKETVLTPARLVTMQYASTFGTLSYFDLEKSTTRRWMTYMINVETGEEELIEARDALALLNAGSHTLNPKMIESPLIKRALAREGVETEGKSISELLEGFWNRRDLSFYDINSKTALYPLLAATTQWFVQRESYDAWLNEDLRPLVEAGLVGHELYNGDSLDKVRARVIEGDRDRDERFWGDVVRNTIFLNSRVAYSRKIAMRVLAGRDGTLAAEVAKNSTVIDVVALTKVMNPKKNPYVKRFFKKRGEYSEFISKVLRISNRGFMEVHAPELHEKLSRVAHLDVTTEVTTDYYGLIEENLDIILTTPTNSEENKKSMDQLIELIETHEDEITKFVAAIGNPPYTVPNETNNGATSIYPEFFEISYFIANFASIVSPARWFNAADSATKDARIAIRDLEIEDKFPIMVKYDAAEHVFDSVGFPGGVSWWLYSDKYEGTTDFVRNGIADEYSRPLLGSDGVVNNIASLSMIKNAIKSRGSSENRVIDWLGGIAGAFDKAYGDGRSTDTMLKYSTVSPQSPDDTRLLIPGKHGWRYVPNDLLSNKAKVPQGMVALVFTYASHVSGTSLNDRSMILRENESAKATMAVYLNSTDQLVILYKYARTKLFRVLVDARLSSHATFPNAYQDVPWIFNFDESDPIDWSQSVENIDAQLVKFFGLEEWNDFIQAVEWPFANYFGDEFVDRLVEFGYDPDEVHFWYGRVLDEKFEMERRKQARLDKKNAK